MSDLRAADAGGPPALTDRWRLTPAAAVNALAAGLVAGTVAVNLATALGGDDGGLARGTAVGGLVIITPCLTQFVAEVVLAYGRRAIRHPVLAGVALVTGLGSAGLLFALGHVVRATCTDYCEADLASGAGIEVIAGAVVVYALLTAARLQTVGRFRTTHVEAVIAVLAVGMPIAMTVAFVFGTH